VGQSRRAVALALVGAGLALALLPGATNAATVQTFIPDQGPGGTFTFSSLGIRYSAEAGEVNRVNASATPPISAETPVPGRVDFSDPAGINPGPGCSRPDPTDSTRASCTVPAADIFDTEIRLFDGADHARITGAFNRLVLMEGGEGADDLGASSAGVNPVDPPTVTFVGGRGNDVMSGGPGLDTFIEDQAGNGADVFNGGAGDADTVSYRRRNRGLRLSLDGRANDGAPGEGDQIRSGVEGIVGGPRADRISGNRSANGLFGGGGEDRLSGGSGGDLLEAGPGRTRDRLDGGRGDDLVVGNSGSNRVKGGPGFDRIKVGRGADRIDARDRATDDISCGGGRDLLRIDRLDFFVRGCERVRRKGSPAAVALSFVFVEDIRGPGSLKSEIACPRDGPRRCRGRVIIRLGARTIGTERFDLGRGEVKDVSAELRESDSLRAPALVRVRSRDRSGRLRETGRRRLVIGCSPFGCLGRV